MVKIEILSETGEVKGSVDSNSKIFDAAIKPEVVHQVVVGMLANARNVVASTKTRGEVRGGGKKPWQQKGTGRARAGSSRSPLWVGGGITFGPRSNRNFSKQIPKRLKERVLFMVLTDKVKNNKLLVLENFQIASGKTRDMVKAIKEITGRKADLGKKVLIIIPKKDEATLRASKNLDSVRVVVAAEINILDILNASSVIILKEALSVIEKAHAKQL